MGLADLLEGDRLVTAAAVAVKEVEEEATAFANRRSVPAGSADHAMSETHLGFTYEGARSLLRTLDAGNHVVKQHVA